MYELLEVTSVRRSEIYSRSSSVERSSIDPNELLLRERLERTFINQQRDWASNVKNGEPLQTAAETIDVYQDDPDAFEFRLFSKKSASKSSASSEQALRKIVLRSPTPTNTSPGFMMARRPDAYYFTDVASAQKKEQFESTAISGEEIMNGLKDTWHGFELPWRVKTIPPTQINRLSKTLQTKNEASSIRKRNGKKRRVTIRKEAAVKKATELSARRSKAEEEAAKKEKRTRKNREKKVKKRQRDKLKAAVTIPESG
ncbi:hypothetical protein MMC29_000441 [Sticta canariensis]|nr:hypothetical protein [Sticta canariensis]